jgi:hypothetical protein
MFSNHKKQEEKKNNEEFKDFEEYDFVFVLSRLIHIIDGIRLIYRDAK